MSFHQGSLVTSDAPIDRLGGEALSSVSFVADYVQFDFNGPRLSVLVWPRVVISGEARRSGDPGYRDALCPLIGRAVTTVSDTPVSGVVVEFGDAALIINPEPDELQGPEVAMQQMNDDTYESVIWRPGEGSFDRQW